MRAKWEFPDYILTVGESMSPPLDMLDGLTVPGIAIPMHKTYDAWKEVIETLLIIRNITGPK